MLYEIRLFEPETDPRNYLCDLNLVEKAELEARCAAAVAVGYLEHYSVRLVDATVLRAEWADLDEFLGYLEEAMETTDES